MMPTATESQILAVLVGGLALLCGYLVVLKVLVAHKQLREPAAKTVSVIPVITEFATMTHLKELEAKFNELKDNFRLDLQRGFQALDEKGETRASETHKRINGVEKAITRVATQTEFLIREVFHCEPPEPPAET